MIPGIARLYMGRVRAGGYRIFFATTAGLLLASAVVSIQEPLAHPLTPPLEIGGLGVVLPLFLSLILLGPLYVGTWWESLRRLQNLGRHR